MFTVMYHSLLIGAALFVPIPFLDERLAAFLWRHMVSDLAKHHRRHLTNEQIQTLSLGYRFSLSDGCLFLARRIFREFLQEILFILEWRRAINLAVDAYYSGYLLNELFAYEGFDPARAGQYAIALKKARRGTSMKLVQGVFRDTFRSGRGVLASVVKWLSGVTVGYVREAWTRRRNRKESGSSSDQQIENFFEMHRTRFQTLIQDLIVQLQTGIGSIPREHFDHLRERLFNEIRAVEAA